MRWRALASAGLVAALGAACGIDALGTMPVAGSEGTLPDGAPNPNADGAASSSSGDANGGSSSGAIDSGGDGTIITGPPPTPSHVPVAIDPNAPDLDDVVSINTTTRTIARTGGAAAPAGLRFEDQNGRAVLFVSKFRVLATLTVTGSAPLVILAAKDVDIEALLDASAKTTAAGPGGSTSNAGSGKGGNAVPSGTDDPGGGGAGFGTAGAQGGDGAAVPGGTAGASYGALLTDFFGGSGGGNGSPYDVSPCTAEDGRGGAGGGAIQITSGGRIRIRDIGVINAAGGGGKGGCLNGGSYTMSGGGGGSGGTIFLEAPQIVVEGTLAANGGGGGGGAAAGESTAGQNGQDGRASLVPALGGTGATDRMGGVGAVRNVPPVKPGVDINNNGGGGGAVGRIWLRTRGTAADVQGSTISPAPQTDTTL